MIDTESGRDGNKVLTIPYHVAVIMDGNGRWATARGLAREKGHKAGLESLKCIVDKTLSLGVSVLSVYCFSTENWFRPIHEINALFQLMLEYFSKNVDKLQERGIRLQVVGDLEKLDVELQRAIKVVVEKSKNNKRLRLVAAINYGGRQELISAIQRLGKSIQNGEIEPFEIDNKLLEREFWLKNIPDPDLLIRTGGEIRLSNFYLWQLAYTELYFTPILWPEFRGEHFIEAIEEFRSRERRFGRVS